MESVELFQLELFLPVERVEGRPALLTLVEPGTGRAAPEAAVEEVPHGLTDLDDELVDEGGLLRMDAAVDAEEVRVVDRAFRKVMRI